MSKEPLSWTDEEQVRRVFKLTPDDLHFLLPLRSDAKRLHRALVLVWARVERVLLSDPAEFPAAVVVSVSKQLGLKPSVLSQLRVHPAMRAAAQSPLQTRSVQRPGAALDHGRSLLQL